MGRLNTFALGDIGDKYERLRRCPMEASLPIMRPWVARRLSLAASNSTIAYHCMSDQ